MQATLSPHTRTFGWNTSLRSQCHSTSIVAELPIAS